MAGRGQRSDSEAWCDEEVPVQAAADRERRVLTEGHRLTGVRYRRSAGGLYAGSGTTEGIEAWRRYTNGAPASNRRSTDDRSRTACAGIGTG